MALNANNGVFGGIHPDSAPGEIFVWRLGFDREHVGLPVPQTFRAGHFKSVVFRGDAGSLAKIRTRGLRFGLQEPRENKFAMSPTVP